ncbi:MULTISPECIES: aminotransferase class V-fold PLP-dependent enzyme [unclassified Paraburkholderia]|uniref:aminotransferase class V-fold PLP-dependent enzyme n=1 Tax=unclassified Paraburkholderia TaxID=2615204 RepID=UPI002AAF1D3B|nr:MULTISPECIES: aminotransferase class V-fold PLP-dependent enzyme [unclassified Paraburkholderia]
MLNVEQLRADTPGTTDVVHLNNAGASLMPNVVIDTVMAHLQSETRIGGYEAAAAAEARLEDVYASIARLIGAMPDEIAVVENATRAWDMVFYSLPLKLGDIVLTSTTEYAGNYIPYLQLKRRLGIEIVVVENDPGGQICMEDLRRKLQHPRAKLVTLPVIGTNGGPVQPVEAIGNEARQAGAWFLLDACQGIGQLPLDVQKIGCHALTATSRKYLRGPRGMGFLYVECNLCSQLEPAFLDLHAAHLHGPDSFEIRNDARRFENWECNIAAKLGMGAAVEYALSMGMDAIWTRIQMLAHALRAQLRDVDGVRLQDVGTIQSGIVTFTCDGIDPDDIKRKLASLPDRINVSCSTDTSTMLDMRARGLKSVVRASVHAYNVQEEIDALVYAMNEIALRR